MNKVTLRLFEAHKHFVIGSLYNSQLTVKLSHLEQSYVEIYEMSTLVYICKYLNGLDMSKLDEEIGTARTIINDQDSDFIMLEFQSFLRFFMKHHVDVFKKQSEQFLELSDYLKVLGEQTRGVLEDVDDALSTFSFDPFISHLMNLLGDGFNLGICFDHSHPQIFAKVMSSSAQAEFTQSFSASM